MGLTLGSGAPAGRRLLTLAVVAALLLATAGCRRGDAPADGAEITIPTVPGGAETMRDLPATTATSAPTYVVPDVIDTAYVETVMQALDHVLGDAIRLLVRQAGRVSDEFLNHLVALYTDKEFEFQQGLWLKETQKGVGNRPADPGDPITRIRQLVRADPDCVVIAVERDFSPTLRQPPIETPQPYIALVPASPGRDTLGANPTPWIMSFDGFMDDGSAPGAPC